MFSNVTISQVQLHTQRLNSRVSFLFDGAELAISVIILQQDIKVYSAHLIWFTKLVGSRLIHLELVMLLHS